MKKLICDGPITIRTIDVIKEVIRRLTGRKKSPQEILEDIRRGIFK